MRSTRLALVISLLSPVYALAQSQTANFSGVWHLNSQKSRHSGQAPEDMQAKIQQNGSDVTIIIRVRDHGRDETNSERLRVGTDDNKNDMHGALMVSKAAWDGESLVVDSIATFGTDKLRMHDRWSLSADKQTLTFRQGHQFAAEPAKEDILVFDRQPDSVWTPPQPPKPAEEVYKNIQVMKGVPAPRLMGAMQFFTKSLGVKCDYCHVPNEFDKDDKAPKVTARKMLNMVHQINGDNFPQNQIVSCWMCHRGSAKPEAFPPQ